MKVIFYLIAIRYLFGLTQVNSSVYFDTRAILAKPAAARHLE